MSDPIVGIHGRVGGSVGVVVALTAEADSLSGRRTVPETLEPLPGGTLLYVAGMGPARALRAAHILIEAHCTALVSWGIAGALNPQLLPGTVVVPGRVIAPSGTAYVSDARWRERIIDRCRPGLRVIADDLAGSDHVVSTVAGKSALWQHSGAAAVDMESTPVAAVAAAMQVPFLAIRAVADLADECLPAWVLQAVNPWGQPRPMAMAARLLWCDGADLAKLWRLSRHFRAARRALAAVATRIGPGLLVP